MQRMIKTPACPLAALLKDGHSTEVIPAYKVESASAFHRAVVREDRLPLKPRGCNTEQRNLTQGQWVKVLAHLCSAWNYVQWNSSCHKVLTQAGQWQNSQTIYKYKGRKKQTNLRLVKSHIYVLHICYVKNIITPRKQLLFDQKSIH